MSKEAMKMALEALKFEDSGDPECEHGFMYDECPNDKCDKRRFHEAITTLEIALSEREALAQSRSDVKQEHSVSVGEPVETPQAIYNRVCLGLAEAGCKLSEQQKMVLASLVQDTTPYVPTGRQPVTESHKRKPLTDEQCDAVYDALDEWARGIDDYSLGLPQISGGGKEGARPIIRAAHGIHPSDFKE